nr:NnrU family protein [uncultured Sphingomonas sp.]
MNPLVELEMAAVAFVGGHFLLSHPLRRQLVSAIGEKAFLGLYSLFALATFAWMIWAAAKVGPETPYWQVAPVVWILASLIIWLGSILFAGSLKGNPALPDATGKAPVIGEPRGVMRITRHPMMWGFASWAIAHAIVNPTPSGLIISEAIAVLALVGAAFQDRKKQRRYGTAWAEWVKRTSFFPFGRGLAAPGWSAFIVGTLLFSAATWAHAALGYQPAGF